jgi:antitoxin (DNA-binding transcriptional repressor) of toxin-antitoxin stability system
MRKVSIRELHTHTSELVREAAEGAVIAIERRGESVAELRPIPAKRKKVPFPDMTDLWARMPQIDSDRSTEIISEDRDRGI